MAINCLGCKHNRICTIYQQYKDIIKISSCTSFSAISNTPELTTSSNLYWPSDVRSPGGSTSLHSRIEDRKEIIKSLNDKRKADIAAADAHNNEKVTCAICGKEFRRCETTVCDNCGKVICMNDANEDLTTNKTLCDNCYDVDEGNK